MKKALRSNYEPGSPREAVRRAQWKALGLTDADMQKPKIAVVNSSSELAICFSHLDGIAKVVKEAIRAAGGLPFEIRTAAPSDFIIGAGCGGGYILASRDLIVNDMEIAVEGAQLDGMICLSSCDKTMPAHLMAAGRFNVPTILVICGYQPSGEFQGKHVDIEDVFFGSVQTAFGKLSRQQLRDMSDHAIRGPGVCSGMATANSMHVVCEALGMTPARQCAGARQQPEDVRQRAPLRHAHRRDGARGSQAARHPDARARSTMRSRPCSASAARSTASSICRPPRSKPASISTCSRCSTISATRDSGAERRAPERHRFDRGVRGGRRSARLDEAARTLDSRPAHSPSRVTRSRRTSRSVIVADAEVIRPLDRPFSDKPPIVVLRGSLAPESAIVKLGVRDGSRKAKFSGPAIVFDDGNEAMQAIQKGAVRPGHVLVVRGMGPKGGPGMAGPASMVVFAIDSAGLQNEVAFVSDGQLSGLCNKGLTVAEVSPEAAVGGPLSLVQNGDRISIDVDKHSLELRRVAPPSSSVRRARVGDAGSAEVTRLPPNLPAHGATHVHRRRTREARRRLTR